jgi:serine O-acetyltransferase
MLHVSCLHRVAFALQGTGFVRMARLISGISRVLFSAQVPAETRIGRGTVFGYGGIGVVLHRNAVIGANVLISPGVVIGGRSGLAGVPVIEDDVAIGAGAKVLGPIRVGAGARIGANAVVIDDVAPGDTVVGVPARSVRDRKPRAESAAPFIRSVALG